MKEPILSRQVQGVVSHSVNLFSTYRQQENNFTNGLFSLLQIAAIERPGFVASFLRRLLHIASSGKIEFRVRVLRKIDSADAELRSRNICLRFETKVKSGALKDNQIRRRLKELKKCPGQLKRVILLTPDDPKSRYIKQILAKYKPRVLHLGWKAVYDYLESSPENGKKSVFTDLVEQFLEQIHECVFKQDFAGVITKIAFGDYTGVYPTTTEDHVGYLEEMREWGEGDWWNTPRPYKELDGTGRKLLFYDRYRKEITAEVEIKKVRHNKWAKAWKSRNVFGSRPKIFRKRIPLEKIRSIPGFENFGKPFGKDKTPYRNITREQYRQLTESM